MNLGRALSGHQRRRFAGCFGPPTPPSGGPPPLGWAALGAILAHIYFSRKAA